MINDDKAIKALNNTDKRAAGLSKVLGGLGKAAMVVGTALVVGFGAALASGIKGSIEAENAVSQLEAVLKSTGGTSGMTKDNLIALADGLQATTKFSTEMALEAESLLLTFTNIGQETFPRATQAAADMATALGTDMAGQSIALGKALNDPTKGITALTRVGVSFTQGQKDSIKAMQESGDMAGAQTIILKELEKEFGGSAAAAGDTFAGKLEILKNKWGDVTEALAGKFMPYLEKFMDWVDDNMPAIQATMQTVFDGITTAIENVIDVVTDVIDWFVKYQKLLVPLAAGIGAAVIAFGIYTAVMWLATAASTAFGAIMAFITSPIGIIVLAIGLLIAIGILLYKNWDVVVAWLKQAWESIKTVAVNVFTAVKDFFVNTFNSVKNFIVGVWDSIIAWLKTAWNSIINAAVWYFTTMFNFYSSIFNAIKNIIVSVWTSISTWLTTAWNNITTTVSNVFNGIKTAVTTIFESIKSGIAEKVEAVRTAIANVFGKIKEIMTEPFNTARDLIKTVIDKIKGFLSFNWEFPKIKMPHFSVKGSANPLDWFSQGLPKISVDWYAKGGIFDQPTIFNTPYGLKGVGEAGPEVVAPLSELKKIMGESAAFNLDYDKLAEAMMKFEFVVDDRKFGRMVKKAYA